MFRIIGGDEKEYGPYSADEVRQWIREGRLNAKSRIRAEGTEAWKTVAEFAEFTDMFGSGSRPQAPPPIPPVSAVESKTSGLAVASLVLGILGLFTCGVSGLIGLVVGIIALSQISKSRGRLTGNGLAIGGICVSGLFVLVLPITAALLFPAVAKARSRAQQVQCMNNARQIALAWFMYADDNKSQFPPAERWCDAIVPYLGTSTNVFECPSRAGQGCAFAANAQVLGRPITELKNPARTVLFFESNLGRNQAGDVSSASANHGHLICVGFTDGHVEMVTAERLNSLVWGP